ncbi:helix-turn-helix transcriptional regulator [Oscillatoria sp. FACHB-1407]|uniref:AraC family transcriptional regulator n=1 Tax=Oscillatoria sp. FACHB-1407 TaxID=2692847 RepID=UPI00168A1413|nr:AraC family transcriptional regulator [Oscillatoria sp. FACHB-1407]MBD2460265.1 helix-turn-helix transcriptional regulator [Oscillatoria sp. FACHB-1407]
MPKPQSLTIDLKQTESFLQIFPRSPVQVSNPSTWQGIFLAHHRQPAWEMPENHVSQHILSVNIGAASKVERVIDGQLQRERFLPGNTAIYPSEVDYTLRWERDVEFILLGIDPVLLQQTAIDVLNQNTVELVPLLDTTDPLIHSMALTLKAELENSQLGGRMYVEAIAQSLSIHLLRNYSVHPKAIPTALTAGLPKHKLHQAVDYIHEHLQHELTLADIAAVVQMSPFHFARLFKQSTGLAPHQFVIRCRVERAKELLLRGQMAIADIAIEVGFANQSHLNRHFKRIVGVTPKIALENSKNVSRTAKA